MQIQVEKARKNQKVNNKFNFFSLFGTFELKISNIYSLSDFKCSTCKKAYSSKSTLAAHEKTHQAVDQNKCKFCKIEFKKQSAYEKHMETEHPLYVQRLVFCYYCHYMNNLNAIFFFIHFF